MMRKQLIGVLMLALTFALSACAPEQPSAAPPVDSVSVDQVSATDLAPYLHLNLAPVKWEAQLQKWSHALHVENISSQTVTDIKLASPYGNGMVYDLAPQESFSAPGGWLPTDKTDFTIQLSYKVDGMPHQAKVVYRVGK